MSYPWELNLINGGVIEGGVIREADRELDPVIPGQSTHLSLEERDRRDLERSSWCLHEKAQHSQESWHI